MAIFIDVLLIALFLLTVIKHARLGLACSILSAGRFLFCLVLAGILYLPVGSLICLTGVPTAFSGTLAFLLIFLVSMIISKLLIKLLSTIKIPIITKIDKLLGFFLGLVLGIIITSLITTSLYTVLELISSTADGGVMNVYTDSYVFKIGRAHV